LQATEISKLQLIIAYIWLIVFILTSRALYLATRSFYDEKRLTRHNSAL